MIYFGDITDIKGFDRNLQEQLEMENLIPPNQTKRA